MRRACGARRRLHIPWRAGCGTDRCTRVSAATDGVKRRRKVTVGDCRRCTGRSFPGRGPSPLPPAGPELFQGSLVLIQPGFPLWHLLVRFQDDSTFIVYRYSEAADPVEQVSERDAPLAVRPDGSDSVLRHNNLLCLRIRLGGKNPIGKTEFKPLSHLPCLHLVVCKSKTPY